VLFNGDLKLLDNSSMIFNIIFDILLRNRLDRKYKISYHLPALMVYKLSTMHFPYTITVFQVQQSASHEEDNIKFASILFYNKTK
jgi:hypothetical protein